MNSATEVLLTGLRRYIGDYDPALFWTVLILFTSIIGCGLLLPEQTAVTLVGIRNYVIFNFSWAFLLGVGASLFFAIYLIFSPCAHVKLGREEDKPEFSFFT